jgi:RecA/RadA recombinase
MNEFLSGLVKDLDDEHTTIAVEGKSSAEFSGTIDTGSYVLNAVLSGSIYGGVANNKITVFAGETATGKTFFVLGVVKQFLETHPEAVVIYFDTESAVTNDMMTQRGIDVKRVAKSEPESIQKFRHIALKGIDHYINQDDSFRPPMMMILDSLGQLSSTKELEDTAEGSETKDMTKAAILKATFRVLNLKLAKAGIPMLVCNHVYDVVGSYYPMKEMSGGSGLKYSASTIAFLSKKKEREGTEVVGNVIKVKMQKSRLSKENKEVECLLTYDKGLDRYYGLVDLALDAGIFTKSGNRVETTDGTKSYPKVIYTLPEKYFTGEVMSAIEEYANKEFKYGHIEEEGEEDKEEVFDNSDELIESESVAIIESEVE